MKILKFNIFISIILLFFTTSITNAAKENPFQNMIVYKKPLDYSKIEFKDKEGRFLNIAEYKNHLIIINFWASWCAPCIKEMPSLDTLQLNKKINNLKIFPISLEGENIQKAQNFFAGLDIKNISFFFDHKLNLTKLFSLRGVPTTILINRDGKEFARITGSVDFLDPDFINWISKY
tara:strand:+ start:226 stop:756 length:531 start_codon:yes stop_codon:yes gene_type:complete